MPRPAQPIIHLNASHAASLSDIDAFIDAIWLEEGLAKNSLAAYRRDLSLYARWLAEQQRSLNQTDEQNLKAYFSHRAKGEATSANRRLTVLKRYFRWALRQNLVLLDPTLKLQPAKQLARIPDTLTEAQVEALLAAPDTSTALGIRDRTMLELMYASGLRVSELVELRVLNVSLNDNVLRVLGKGSKERLVPFGQVAADWLRQYLGAPRQELLAERQTQDLFITARGSKAGSAMSPGDVLDGGEEVCPGRRHSRAAVAAHLAPCLCHAFAEPRRRSACRANALGPCRYFHHYDLYPCGARAAGAAACATPPARLDP